MCFLYLEVEGQSRFVGSVDQDLIKNRQIDLLDLSPMAVESRSLTKKFAIFLEGLFAEIFRVTSLRGKKY